ncbi:uncharacterized protein TRAVEDRAFT_44091 [Trametes versicolor FP-101664 SS1]|uniref:uncharacterized protein n=1 Tax=Trametes versicolor (strain FP-101664) TaxID=717944 RepID=UPI0004621AAE|nr:uncharacterized protein TRAVEDRAFT_44091 [Trametes versicolor FP-101664 SS1]EIW61275.1 hypothetical protein TRAVEDRAFT_44091 [Trametes versicolor FP-101664 SS1]
MSSRVYLGALPENVSTTEVHKYLSMYGQILEIKLRQGESQEGYSPYRLDAGQQVLASCNSTARRTPWTSFGPSVADLSSGLMLKCSWLGLIDAFEYTERVGSP